FADGGSPLFSLHLDAESQELFLRRKKPEGGYQYLGRWAVETQRWYDVAFHVKWAKDKSGVFEFYLDGQLMASYSGRTAHNSDEIFTRWGINGQPTKLYFDEVRIASGADKLGAVSP